MARLFPFRALSYDPTAVNMADVVTQPYDKIDSAMQDRYYNLSPYNLVRIVLGKKQPDDNEEHNVYTRAAETLNKWRGEHILREETTPALYGYSQTYTVPGTGGTTGIPAEIRERRGFIALGQLSDYADKIVYRHEQTFPKHKSDRLALFKATRAYCEQIYMLYSDPTFTAEHVIFEAPPPTVGDSKTVPHVTRSPDLEIVDEYHVVHRVWKVTEPKLIREVKPQYTADAMRAKVQGEVELEAVVNPDGSVDRIRVTRSLDRTFGLDQKAIEAVRQWRFMPGMRQGQPVAVRVSVVLDFTLR